MERIVKNSLNMTFQTMPSAFCDVFSFFFFLSIWERPNHHTNTGPNLAELLNQQ